MLLVYLSIISTLVLAVIALRADLDNDLKGLRILFVIAAIVEIISFILAKLSINNLFLFHIYTPIELGVVSYYFLKQEFLKDKMAKIILLSIIVSAITLDFLTSSFEKYDVATTVFECIVFLMLSLRLLLDQYHNKVQRYIALSYLFYGFTNAVFYLFFYEIADKVMYVYWLICIVTNILLGVALICQHKEKQLASRYLF